MQNEAIRGPEESISKTHTHEKQTTWYFVTNQLNLLYMLGAGMIMPPKGFGHKYYEDSLSMVPGWIPLFLESVPRDALTNAVKESRTLKAVIVALNLSSMKGSAQAVYLNGKMKSIYLPEDLTSQHPCVLLPAPLPTRLIECIYFETNEDKKAFEQDATGYANVPIQFFKRATRKKLFAQAGHWYWPKNENSSSRLNVPMDSYQAAGGIMAMLLNCGNMGEFSMLACEAAFDGLSSAEKFKVEGSILEGLVHWMQHGEKPDSKNVLNDLYWGIVDQIIQNNLNQHDPLPLKDTLLNYLEAFKEKTDAKYAKALSDLVADLRGIDQFGAQNITELLETHKGEVRRALILLFLFKNCSELVAFSHPLMERERLYRRMRCCLPLVKNGLGFPLNCGISRMRTRRFLIVWRSLHTEPLKRRWIWGLLLQGVARFENC